MVQVTGAFQRFQSLNKKLSQSLAHSLEFDALRADRIEYDGTVCVISHQFSRVTVERVGSIQIQLKMSESQNIAMVKGVLSPKTTRALANSYLATCPAIECLLKQSVDDGHGIAVALKVRNRLDILIEHDLRAI